MVILSAFPGEEKTAKIHLAASTVYPYMYPLQIFNQQNHLNTTPYEPGSNGPGPPNTKQDKTRQVRVLLHLGFGIWWSAHPRQTSNPEPSMRQALLIIDVQPSFAPPQWLVDGIQTLIGTLPSVATVERHDETKTHSKNNSAVTRRRMMPA
jgi:hypothetical protein